MAPMSHHAWEEQESVVREVFDPLSGRTRLIKGSGEVLERIVRREEQGAINAAATARDGAYFLAASLQKAQQEGAPQKKRHWQ